MSRDIHFKGDFPSIHEAWKVYPNGGGFGDYITVNGVRIDWHEYTHSWGEQVEREGIVRPAEIIDHSINVLGKGTFKDGIEAGDFIPGKSGAVIDEDGCGEMRTLKVDSLFIKYNGENISLSEYIKLFKTELPPDWTEYANAPLFNDIRLLVFDPADNKKYYTTVKNLKDTIAAGFEGGGNGGGSDIEVIRSDDTNSTPTDNNVMSSLRVLAEIKKYVKENALSRINDDTAAGHITFNAGFTSKELGVVQKGIQIGENFVPGLTGLGGMIDKDGHAVLRSATLYEWLQVPEMRYNRVEVLIGDRWRAAGAGIFESVDTERRIIKLKLEDGEAGTFKVDDICMGIYHSMVSEENATSDYDDSRGNRRFAGFATSYFRIIQVMDERGSELRYDLRPASAAYPNPIHPSQFMHAVAYGNFTDADRQSSVYETRTYQRYLRKVNDWEFTLNNIAAQFGNLQNMSVHGQELAGYSAYLNNVYFTGVIHQLTQQIQDELAKQQVGGKNLLREYDIRFNFKYWGGQGEYVEVDINTIRNAAYLQVSPSFITLRYPEREATITVKSDVIWTMASKPAWLQTDRTSGAGDAVINISAGVYTGRTARQGAPVIRADGLTDMVVNVNQAGKPEFVEIEPYALAGRDGGDITITGRSNSAKLTFSLSETWIALPAKYTAGAVQVNNGADITGDPGAAGEYVFSITVNMGMNGGINERSAKLAVMANNGQKAECTIMQNPDVAVLLATEDGYYITTESGILIDLRY